MVFEFSDFVDHGKGVRTTLTTYMMVCESVRWQRPEYSNHIQTTYIPVCESFQNPQTTAKWYQDYDGLHDNLQELKYSVDDGKDIKTMPMTYMIVCESFEIPLTTAKMSRKRRLLSERDRSTPSVPWNNSRIPSSVWAWWQYSTNQPNIAHARPASQPSTVRTQLAS